jgi:hypothetical protein
VVIIIIIGKAKLVLHNNGIIAQTYFPVESHLALQSYPESHVAPRANNHPNAPAAIAPITMSKNKTGVLNSNR